MQAVAKLLLLLLAKLVSIEVLAQFAVITLQGVYAGYEAWCKSTATPADDKLLPLVESAVRVVAGAFNVNISNWNPSAEG